MLDQKIYYFQERSGDLQPYLDPAINAIASGDLSKLTMLVNLHRIDKYENICVSKGKDKSLYSPYDPHSIEVSLLEVAAYYGHKDIFRYLIDTFEFKDVISLKNTITQLVSDNNLDDFLYMLNHSSQTTLEALLYNSRSIIYNLINLCPLPDQIYNFIKPVFVRAAQSKYYSLNYYEDNLSLISRSLSLSLNKQRYDLFDLILAHGSGFAIQQMIDKYPRMLNKIKFIKLLEDRCESKVQDMEFLIPFYCEKEERVRYLVNSNDLNVTDSNAQFPLTSKYANHLSRFISNSLLNDQRQNESLSLWSNMFDQYIKGRELYNEDRLRFRFLENVIKHHNVLNDSFWKNLIQNSGPNTIELANLLKGYHQTPLEVRSQLFFNYNMSRVEPLKIEFNEPNIQTDNDDALLTEKFSKLSLNE